MSRQSLTGGPSDMEVLARVSNALQRTFSFADPDVHSQKLVARLGHQGTILQGHLDTPNGVAVNQQGDIIVADTGNHRLVVFDARHRLKRIIGTRGSQPDQLHFPVSVTLLSSNGEEEILVTDSVNTAVKSFSQDGEFLRQYNPDSVFEFPHGIAVSQSRHMAVTDLIKHCVVILNRFGEIECQFGCYGNQSHNLDHPNHIAINSENHVIVVDTGNSAVKIFSFSGDLLKEFSVKDFRIYDDDCAILNGLTIDHSGNILLLGHTTVYVLAPNGRLWEVLLPDDGLYSPKCIAYDPRGLLIISQYDLGDKRELSVFKYDPGDFKCLSCTPTSAYS